MVDLQELLFGEDRSLDILKLESAADLELLTQNRHGSIGLDQADEGDFADRYRMFLLVQAAVSRQLAQLFASPVSSGRAATEMGMDVLFVDGFCQPSHLTADIRKVYAEAKAEGFDVAVMRKIVSLRKMDKDDRSEMESILDLYKRALGMGES